MMTFKRSFLQKIISGTQSVSDSLDPDQDLHNVGPDLYSYCL